MVGDAPLGEVVGPDPLGAVAAPDEQPPLRRPLRRLPVALRREQAGPEQGEGARPVLVLRPLVLALHHHAGRQVGDADRGVGLVDVLPPRPRRPEGVDLEVSRVDLHLAHVLDLGQHRHRARGGVDPALRLRLRHPLDPMPARLELEPRVRLAADHADHRLAVAAVLALAPAHDLDGPPPRLRVPQVHAQEVPGEERRLLAARAGPDLEERVAVVGRVHRNEQGAELALHRVARRLRLAQLVPRQLADLRVRVPQHLARRLDRVDRAAVTAVAVRDGVQIGQLLRERAKAGLVRDDAGVGEQPAQLLPAPRDRLELVHNGRVHSAILARWR